MGGKLCDEIEHAGLLNAYSALRQEQPGTDGGMWDVSADYGTRSICEDWSEGYREASPVMDVD